MKARLPALLALLFALSACGSEPPAAPAPQRAAGPGAGKPPVRLATKNFTEQYILGEVYGQALRSRGFTIELKPDVGSSEIVDRAMTSGGLDMYPEYIGVIVQELANQRRPPKSAQETYRRAKAFEAQRGFALLDMTPGFDALAHAVLPALARRHDLETTGDLRRLGAFKLGGPAENRTRFQGAIGLREVYGLRRMQYVSLKIPDRYAALDSGRVDVISVFTTEGQLADRSRYRVLSDPQGVFGYQNIAPVVSRRVLREQGPEFARIVNAVSAKLTNRVLRQMNGAVDLEGRRPADVARAFLRDNDLL